MGGRGGAGTSRPARACSHQCQSAQVRGAEPVAVQIPNQSTKLQVTQTDTKTPGSDFQDIIFTVTSVIVNIDGKLLEELCEDTRYHANNTVEGMF